MMLFLRQIVGGLNMAFAALLILLAFLLHHVEHGLRITALFSTPVLFIALLFMAFGMWMATDDEPKEIAYGK